MKRIITDDYEFEHIIGGKAVYVDSNRCGGRGGGRWACFDEWSLCS